MGNKLYATEMAKVLDPTGLLFNGRVISRGDDGDPFDGDERVPKSKDLEGVLGMESAVVIIDDSVRVWPHNKLNLIVVERLALRQPLHSLMLFFCFVSLSLSLYTHSICVAGIFIFLVVDVNLGFQVLLFLRLTMMRDQKMELWHALWR